MKFDNVQIVGNEKSIKNMKKDMSFTIDKLLAVDTNIARWKLGENIVLDTINFNVKREPTGSDIIFGVKCNGTPIGIAAIPENQTFYSLDIEQEVLSENDVISIDITQVGSIYAGSHLNVQFIYTNK